MKQERKIVAYKHYFLDFISSLNEKEAIKIYYVLDMLKVQNRVPVKFVKYLRDGLYEIRAEWNRNIYRVFFCFDEDRNIMVGAVNIRHYLNESLLRNGGHIGDGVRPSERRKGIATKMIALALDECRKLGIEKVLMVCDKENIGSAKSIINNGGVLENEVEVDGVIEQRYWIDLTKVGEEG